MYGPIIHSEPYYRYQTRGILADRLEHLARLISRYSWNFHLWTRCHPLSSKFRQSVLSRVLRLIRTLSKIVNYGNVKDDHIIGFNHEGMFAVTSQGYHATIFTGIDENGQLIVSDQWSPQFYDGIRVPLKK